MVYISSPCVKHAKIISAIKELQAAGIKAIELSGGTKPYAELEQDLQTAQQDWGLDLLLHNYFPPPTDDFVLNLASATPKIRQQSIDHCKKAIAISADLGIKQFGFHAGFYIDIQVAEIGKKLTKTNLTDKEGAIERFCSAHETLKSFAANKVKLYLENNVFSSSNYASFEGVNPLMLTSLEDYKALRNKIDFNLLLDVAHLKVSCNTLNKNFDKELKALFAVSDYIHISDNDGLHDTNNALIENSDLYRQLNSLDWTGKTVTLEIYEALDKVKASLELTKKMINA